MASTVQTIPVFLNAPTISAFPTFSGFPLPSYSIFAGFISFAVAIQIHVFPGFKTISSPLAS